MPDPRPTGIPGSVLAGPFGVGAYADALKSKLREMARVQVFGEVVGFKVGRAKVFWELRDGRGALPCSMWRSDWEGRGAVELPDGARVVCAGGPDFYPGSRASSPAFSFAVSDVRLAGEGDLLAQLAELRRRLDAEGLFAPQKALARRGVPRTIGVVCGEGGKARDDVVAGLRRRGWSGRLVWAFAPVQDRHAAGAIGRALQDLAGSGEVDVIVVARGGGSLADLFAFCDETLCRTVALLPVPVIASVGHHTDRTLIDDVAAVACSTPTHAAEAAVPVHVGEARVALRDAAGRLTLRAEAVSRSRTSLAGVADRLARRGAQAAGEPARRLAADRALRLSRAQAAVAADRARLASVALRLGRSGSGLAADRARLGSVALRMDARAREALRTRARELAAVSRAPAAQLARQRAGLHQRLREIRAAAVRGLDARDRDLVERAQRLAAHTGGRDVARRRAELARPARALEVHAGERDLLRRRAALARLEQVLAAHDPQRTLERGYALVEDADGEPVTSAAAARSLRSMTVRMHDGAVDAVPTHEERQA